MPRFSSRSWCALHRRSRGRRPTISSRAGTAPLHHSISWFTPRATRARPRGIMCSIGTASEITRICRSGSAIGPVTAPCTRSHRATPSPGTSATATGTRSVWRSARAPRASRPTSQSTRPLNGAPTTSKSRDGESTASFPITRRARNGVVPTTSTPTPIFSAGVTAGAGLNPRWRAI